MSAWLEWFPISPMCMFPKRTLRGRRECPASRVNTTGVEVAVVALPHMANFDEFDPLAMQGGVRLRYVREADDFGDPDLVILPGSKVTIADMDFVRNSGIEARIRRHLWNGRALIGICGGMQMLGHTIHDPDGIEFDKPIAEGLGVLDLDTRFIGDKLTTRTEGRIVGDRGLLSGTLGMSVSDTRSTWASPNRTMVRRGSWRRRTEARR